MNRRIIYFACIVIGLFVAFYAQAREQQNRFILVGGIILLMFGLYHISKGITPKKEDSNFIVTERDDKEEH